MLKKPAVLISDTVHPLLISGLEEAGYLCHYEPDIDPKTILERMEFFEGIVINSKIWVDRTFLDRSPRLKFIARLGSGLEIIDLAAAQEKGILVHRSPDGNCDAVAEHSLGMLLALANNLCTANADVRKKNWRRELLRGWELKGKNIGIVGFGYTGTAFAQRLSGFGVKVLAFDKYRKNFAKEMPHVVESAMENLFEEVDILSFNIPLTSETKGIFNEEFLQKFKKPIVLINCARGEIVKTQIVLNGLDSGKIIGACLDVFENEKPEKYTGEEEKIFANLFERPNVLLSPHIAGWTHESKRKLSELLLKRILDGSEIV